MSPLVDQNKLFCVLSYFYYYTITITVIVLKFNIYFKSMENVVLVYSFCRLKGSYFLSYKTLFSSQSYISRWWLQNIFVL